MNSELKALVDEVIGYPTEIEDFLMVMNGPEDGRILLLKGAALRMGRSEECGILLNRDPFVSRHHADLTREGDTYSIEDQSKHGTEVDGVRIHIKTPLRHGSIIQIGDTQLRLHCAAYKQP